MEYAGLVKFDFLGLRTLTIIDWALGMINPRKAKKASRRWISQLSRWMTRKLRYAATLRNHGGFPA
ncbi:hypothetical protein ACNKHW_01215 [Shigella flexneri]